MISANAALVKLDYDEYQRPLPFGQLHRRLMRSGYRMVYLWQRRSPGGHGWHVCLCLDPQPRRAADVVALQAILGSDPNREACNLRRARLVDGRRVSKFWRERWNVFYKKR